ncbi:MAG: ABC transporter ATP-binding protein [Cystobacterineae bacterium]|nr:ABC transporter ATP-binding protein [Cystobacterineae bacterium]
MIVVHKLTKTFEKATHAEVVHALSIPNLEVAAGEFVALTGKSGSGKTTLLNILGGLDLAYEGEVYVGGELLGKRSSRALAKLRAETVASVFQSFHLIQGWSAEDNVALPALFSKVSQGGVKSRALQMLEAVGLHGKAKSTPAQLSGGERQRVAIARALFAGARLLLCDEPTGNLDAQTTQGIVDLLLRLNVEGLTLVVATHEPLLLSAAGRHLRLDGGRLQ